jgi:hypothetical protein
MQQSPPLLLLLLLLSSSSSSSLLLHALVLLSLHVYKYPLHLSKLLLQIKYNRFVRSPTTPASSNQNLKLASILAAPACYYNHRGVSKTKPVFI